MRPPEIPDSAAPASKTSDLTAGGAKARARARPKRPARPKPGKVTDVLERLAREYTDDRVSLGDIVKELQSRSHGMLMLVLSLPSMIPITPPGIGVIFGLPVAFVAVQLILRRRHVWLPGFLRRRSMTCEDFQRIIERALPHVARIERLLKPRLTILTESVGECLIGVAVLVLALLLALPLPLTNIPLGLAIALLSLGLIQRDGLVVLIGSIIAIATGVFIVVFGWTAMAGVVALVAGL
ncbi:MAG: exopolysaccharide biosynthesis protein [Dongiaceae bacterium]